MGYHVTLVNTHPEGGRVLRDFEKMRRILAAAGLVEEKQGEDYAYFYPGHAEGFTLFYCAQPPVYYINTTDDAHIAELAKLAALIGSGTRAQGDEGESYTESGTAYIHPDDKATYEAEWAQTRQKIVQQQRRLRTWRLFAVFANIILLAWVYWTRRH